MASKIKKRIKWWGWVLISVALVIVLGGSSAAYILLRPSKSTPLEGKENPYGFEYLGLRTEGDAVTLPPIDDDEDIKAFAAQLYLTAATRAKNAPYLTVYDECTSYFNIGSMVNMIDVSSVVMKDPSRFFKIEYHLKNSIPLFDNAPQLEVILNSFITMVTTERMYTDASMDNMLYQKTLNNKYDSEMVPIADWDDINTEQYKAKPVYLESQTGIFELTQHQITKDTIKEATVTITENNTYYVKLVLDLDNPDTTSVARQSIIDGTGDKNANYSSIAVEFEIWDNGDFRNMKLDEAWSAKVFGIDFSSQFNNVYYFSYYQKDAVMEDFAAAKAFIDEIKK